jgi:hypothetical protein
LESQGPAPLTREMKRVDRVLSLLGWSGLGAAAVYATATFLGGVLDPTYSHIRYPVSELISSRAPDRTLLGGLFITYNAALAVFALGLYRSVKRGRLLATSVSFLVLIAGSGHLDGRAVSAGLAGRAGNARGTCSSA